MAREPTASRAAAELNFIVDVLDIKRNDHLDDGSIVPPKSLRYDTPRNGRGRG